MPKRKSKPKTQEQIDKAAETHRQKKYGVGLVYYDSQLEKQDGGCAVCDSTPKTRRLHIDHDHSWTKVKVTTTKVIVSSNEGGITNWKAAATYLGKTYLGYSGIKSVAIRGVKKQLKEASVRGLLCFGCNSGLKCFGDSPDRLRVAAKYLEDHQGVV